MRLPRLLPKLNQVSFLRRCRSCCLTSSSGLGGAPRQLVYPSNERKARAIGFTFSTRIHGNAQICFRFQPYKVTTVASNGRKSVVYRTYPDFQQLHDRVSEPVRPSRLRHRLARHPSLSSRRMSCFPLVCVTSFAVLSTCRCFKRDFQISFYFSALVVFSMELFLWLFSR